MREATHGSDVLLSHIKLSAALVALLILLANPVYLLVHLCSVVETHLTRASYCPGDTGWMPGSNTSNLSAMGHQHLSAVEITINTVHIYKTGWHPQCAQEALTSECILTA